MYIKVVRCGDCVFLEQDRPGELYCSNLKGLVKPALCTGCSYGKEREVKNEVCKMQRKNNRL